MPYGLFEIGAFEAAERVDGQRHPSRELPEARPAEWSSRRMRGRRQHRAQHHEIDSELYRTRELGLVVTRGCAKHLRRPSLRGHQTSRGPVNPRATESTRDIGVAVEENSRAARFPQGEELLGESNQLLLGERFFAQLDEPDTAVDRTPGALEKRSDAEVLGHGDRIDRRQLQRAQDDRVGRQERRDLERPRRLPGECLPIAASRLSAPAEDAKKIELYVRMRIAIALHQPRHGTRDADPQLFVELAYQRIVGRFAGFEFPARKLPVAGVGCPRQALREQHSAVVANEDRRRDAQDGSFKAVTHLRWRRALLTRVTPLPARRPRAPARSRANCQATRPLRDPRCRANWIASRCSASMALVWRGIETPWYSSQPSTAAR